MDRTKRFLALLLLGAMLLGLWACDDGTAPGPTETTQPEPTETTQPEPTAADIYNEAMAALTALTDGEYSIQITTTRTTGNATYTDEVLRTVYYENIGGENMVAVISSENNFPEDYYFDSREVYAGGTVYYTFTSMDDTTYSAAMDADDFLARQVPISLLDAALYGTVTQSSDTLISFADATALESWVAPEYAELLEASGEAEFWTDGTIKSMTYEASYLQGPVTVEQSYTLKPVSSTVGDLTSYLPDGDKECISVEDIDIPYLVTFANYMSYALQGCSLETGYNLTAASEALGMTYSVYADLYSCGSGEDFLFTTEQDISGTDYSGEYAYTYKEKFADGAAVFSVDGGEYVPYSGTARDYADYMNTVLTYYAPSALLMETVQMEDMNGFWYIEYTGNEEFGRVVEDMAAYDLTGDSDYLDSYAGEYKTDTAEGYVIIDKDSLLPIACGIDYQGRHNIDGTYYRLYYTVNQTISVGDPSVYTEITDEMFPEEEPEDQATPLFYEVTAPDGSKLYLLGTIHVGDERTGNLPQEIYAAFEASDALAVEVDVLSLTERLETDEELQMRIGQSYYYSDGTTLADHLDEELYEQALKMANFGGLGTVADYMYPSVLATAFTQKLLYGSNLLTSEQGVDYRLLRLAREQDKDVLEVESAELQYGMDARYSDNVHKLLLASALESSRNEYCAETMELYTLWCAGDEAALTEYIRDDDIPEDATEEELEAYEEYQRILLGERDAGMLEVAEGYLASGKAVFFAVGLAHLLGETGLVDALRAAGCTVELVQYS